MTKIKKIIGKIKEVLKNDSKLAILILFVLQLFINIWITPDRYDSAFFIAKMQEMSLPDFLSMRYETWTSRIFIEMVVCTVLTHNKLVWILINTIMTTIIGYSIIKLFVKEDNKNLIWMSLCFVFLYPLNKVATCDWGAGTMNYTWPLAMLLFSSIAIKKIFEGERIRKFMYPIYMLALAFACNQEQTCAIAFGLYFVFTILGILKDKKKVHPFLIVQFIISILGLIIIATCPGNYMRKSEEIATYYMDFGTLNIFDKVSLGLTSTLNSLLINSNVVFLIFSLVSAVYIFKTYKENLYRGIALVPLVAGLAFGIFKDALCHLFPYFRFLYEGMLIQGPMLTATNYSNFLNFLPLILAFVILGSITLNILLIFKNLKNNIAILIFALGVMSRIAMGFSPTVFASTDRTFCFFEFALIIVSILIWEEFLKHTDKSQVKARTKLGTFIAVMAVLQYCHTLIYTLVSQV